LQYSLNYVDTYEHLQFDKKHFRILHSKLTTEEVCTEDPRSLAFTFVTTIASSEHLLIFIHLTFVLAPYNSKD